MCPKRLFFFLRKQWICLDIYEKTWIMPYSISQITFFWTFFLRGLVHVPCDQNKKTSASSTTSSKGPRSPSWEFCMCSTCSLKGDRSFNTSHSHNYISPTFILNFASQTSTFASRNVSRSPFTFETSLNHTASFFQSQTLHFYPVYKHTEQLILNYLKILKLI